MSALPDLSAETIVTVTVTVMQRQPVVSGSAMVITHLSGGTITNDVAVNGYSVAEQVAKLARSIVADALLDPRGAALHRARGAAG